MTVTIEYSSTHLMVLSAGIPVSDLKALCALAEYVLEGDGEVMINAKKAKEFGVCLYVERSK